MAELAKKICLRLGLDEARKERRFAIQSGYPNPRVFHFEYYKRHNMVLLTLLGWFDWFSLTCKSLPGVSAFGLWLPYFPKARFRECGPKHSRNLYFKSLVNHRKITFVLPRTIWILFGFTMTLATATANSTMRLLNLRWETSIISGWLRRRLIYRSVTQRRTVASLTRLLAGSRGGFERSFRISHFQ